MPRLPSAAPYGLTLRGRAEASGHRDMGRRDVRPGTPAANGTYHRERSEDLFYGGTSHDAHHVVQRHHGRQANTDELARLRAKAHVLYEANVHIFEDELDALAALGAVPVVEYAA